MPGALRAAPQKPFAMRSACASITSAPCAGVPASIALDDGMNAAAREGGPADGGQWPRQHMPLAPTGAVIPNLRTKRRSSNLYAGYCGARAIDGYIEGPGRHEHTHVPTSGVSWLL